MIYETLNFEVQDGVACIVFNRPKQGNALSPLMAKEFSDAAIRCDDDPSIRAVVLTGEGKLFCAGGDLSAFVAAGAGANSLIKAMAGDLHMALSRLARMDPPVIAAVNGAAGGAGFSIVMAADLAIAAQSAYTNAGLSPDGSSTFYMPRKIGDRRARELMLTNRVLSAAEALDWGVVNQVVADGEALAAAMTLAKRLAAGPTRAYGAVKTLLNESFEHGLESQMELEARKIAELVVSADGQEGIKAFFEKRKPGFTGR